MRIARVVTRAQDAIPGSSRQVKDLTAAKAKGVKGGKSTVSDFNFVHKVDKASPVLFQG